jgi:cystathionine beta-lyase/cystathionine gamma-synthase
MEKHHSNSLSLARFLEVHDCVEKVIHPLLPSHPSNELAKLQNRNTHSGVFSFYMKGGEETTKAFMACLKLVGLAVSLGGLHSTLSVPAMMSHKRLTNEEKKKTGITANLVRISVGLENVDDIKADLDQALKRRVKAD